MHGNFCVLVVEDDVDVRDALIFLLEEEEGLRAVGAGNGREAIDRIEGGLEPEVILLDLMMPVMDGESFLRIRKADARLSAIPVVVVSALQKMQIDPVEFNVDEVIPKPVDPDRVIETVRRYATG